MRNVISTDQAPKAIGPYSVAIQTDGLVFCSGQIGLDPASGELAAADVEGQTRQALTNLKHVLEAAGSSLDQVVKIIETPVTLGIANNDDGTVTVSFSGTPGAQYIVQAKSDLGSAAAWENVSTNTAGADGKWTYSEAMESNVMRFFRSAKP